MDSTNKGRGQAEIAAVLVPDSPSSGAVLNSSVSSQEKSSEFNEQTNYVPVRTIITIFLACAGVDFLALMDQTMLATSLHTIGDSLGSTSQVSWIANGYFITSTIGQLLYGRLSDIWSRKVILLLGLAVFFIGSLASSLAHSVLQLTIFRAVTGIGGGGLMTVAQLIVSDVVPLRERGKYQGILGAVVALGNGAGPVVGGALASKSSESWRWIFRLSMPLTILTTLGVIRFMPLKKVEGDWRMKVKAVDFIGIVIAFVGTTFLMLGLTWGGGEYRWQSGHVIATIVVGFSVCVVFTLWQWKGPRYPLVPLHMFESKIVNGACISMAINGWNFVVQVYYIPMFYQLVYGYSATKSGVMLLPITLVQTLSSTLSGLVVHATGRYRECILFGWVCWAAGLGLMSTLDQDTGVGKQVGYSLLIGVGVGNTLQPALIAIQAGVKRPLMAVVTSFRNFIRNLGAALGLAICGTIIGNTLRSSFSSLGLDDASFKRLLASPQAYLGTVSDEEGDDIRARLTPAYQEGFRIVFLVGAASCALGFFIVLFMIPQLDLAEQDAKPIEEERKAQQVSEK